MKTAIVTGAASGFGAATAERLARDGHAVVVADLNEGGAGNVVDRINGAGGKAVACACNVADADAYSAMADLARSAFGDIDIVVNNAGYTHPRSAMEDVTEDDFYRVVDVNLKALFYTGKFIVPGMKKRGKGGTIINVSSTAAKRPGMALTWYSAAKAAVNVASQGMAMELGHHGIRVNAIEPVIGETGMLTRFMGQEDSPEARSKFGGSIPLGRFCKPADVANVVGFLCGPDGSFVNGHCLPVDGGFLGGAYARPAGN